MTSANNAASPIPPLRAGLIGSGGRLERVMQALTRVSEIQIAGQAGMPQSHALPDVPWYDDVRVLLAQSGLDAIVLAGSPRRDAERGALATEHELPVWRLPPAARSFGEATEVARHIQRGPNVNRVASWWEYIVDHVWNDVTWPPDFTPSFSEVLVRTVGPPLETWEANLEEAGGGVLALDTYDMLEALIAIRGLPESVVATLGHHRGPATGADRETEDTALALLRYAGGGTGVIRATWDLAPSEKRVRHHARSATLVISDASLLFTEPDGRVLAEHPLPGEYLESELRRFAELARTKARDRAAAPIERHLAVTALLEAIYLAARTSHPESPRKRYEAHGWPEPRV